jgi:hypothetical protein
LPLEVYQEYPVTNIEASVPIAPRIKIPIPHQKKIDTNNGAASISIAKKLNKITYPPIRKSVIPNTNAFL